MTQDWSSFAQSFPTHYFTTSVAIQADSFAWMKSVAENSVHSVVTDPPYGVKEYDLVQLEKRANDNGGIWRIPPTFDGSKRSPLPRFTALSQSEREHLSQYFLEWARLVRRVLRPGGHLFIASNSFLAQDVFASVSNAGLEFRGQIIRLVRTLRGGDRPKNAEGEFPGVCSMARGAYEPWGMFREPLPKGMKVSDCLARYQTGGLRRKPDGRPFEDVIESGRTPKREREIAPHPSLKPQSFLRQIVYASLPLGEGLVLDPFMGSGSTVAAAEAVGYRSIGIERVPDYFAMSRKAVPALAEIDAQTAQIEFTLA